MWIGLWFLLKLPQVRFFIDVSKLNLPILGKEIIRKGLMSRFCRTLGALLSGGVGLSTSLAITAQAVNNRLLENAIERIRLRVTSGASLSDEMRKHDVFPRFTVKMVGVGEKTGHIDEMLHRTADYYDKELEISLQNLTVLLEPALIIFIGGIVLTVVLALYLPIFKLSSAIR